MDIHIREARPDEADTLTDIAVKAKSHWDYTSEQIEMWLEFLTFTPDYIRENQVWVAVNDDMCVGVAAIEHTEGEIVLEHLWVLPSMMGHGVGKQLFLSVADHESEFVFTSDPHADAFYIKMGAVKIGEYESNLQGRVLNRFRYRANVS